MASFALTFGWRGHLGAPAVRPLCLSTGLSLSQSPAVSRSRVSRLRRTMLRRSAGVAVVLLILAAPAHAGSLGSAEVRSPDGTLIGKAGAGADVYPADR